MKERELSEAWSAYSGSPRERAKLTADLIRKVLPSKARRAQVAMSWLLAVEQGVLTSVRNTGRPGTTIPLLGVVALVILFTAVLCGPYFFLWRVALRRIEFLSNAIESPPGSGGQAPDFLDVAAKAWQSYRRALSLGSATSVAAGLVFLVAIANLFRENSVSAAQRSSEFLLAYFVALATVCGWYAYLHGKRHAENCHWVLEK